jgi:hypothetical protein
LHLYTENTAIASANYYDNVFFGSTGQHTTSQLVYFEADASGSTFNNCNVYNNICKRSTENYGNFGAIAVGGVGTVTNALIANNTLLGNSSAYGILVSGTNNHAKIENNIIKGWGEGGIYYTAAPGVTWDHNFYSGNTNLGELSNATTYNTLSAWQTGLGGTNEAHGINNAASGISTDGMPDAGCPAIDAGTSLATFFTTDYAGITRPQGPAWDIGAYEYVAGTAAASPAFDHRVLPLATISLRNSDFAIALSVSAQSPELAVVDISGRVVYRAMLNKTGEAVYNCAWDRAPAAGAYFAVVKETSRNDGGILARTKFVIGK